MKITIESIRSIAIFMGAVHCPEIKNRNWRPTNEIMEVYHFGRKQNDENAGYTIYGLQEMKYGSSWEWLMPVIEKISHIDCIASKDDDGHILETYYPLTFGMLDEDTGFPMFRFNRMQVFIAPTLIEVALIAVVDFIECYINTSL